jgi:hypothetical protein
MTKIERQKELFEKIMAGLDKTYQKLIEFKKQKKSELVVLRDGKIVRLKPEEL